MYVIYTCPTLPPFLSPPTHSTVFLSFKFSLLPPSPPLPHTHTHLFLSTLKSARASFLRLALVFILMQNSTAKSSTNFLFISRGSLEDMGQYKTTH